MRRLALVLVVAGVLAGAGGAWGKVPAVHALARYGAMKAPATLTFREARSAIARYYRADYFRIYRCTREGLRRVRCLDGLMVDAGSQAVWCNGYDSVAEFAHRVHVVVGGCDVTISVP